MYSHYRTEKYPRVNSKLSLKEDNFVSITKLLGGNGDLVLRWIAFECRESASLSCIVPLQRIAEHAKCSIDTVKRKINILRRLNMVIRHNRRSFFSFDAAGNRVRKWRSNRYIITPLGLNYLKIESNVPDLSECEDVSYGIRDVWDRNLKEEEPDPKIESILALQVQIDKQKRQVYLDTVQNAVGISGKNKKEERGNSFSHGKSELPTSGSVDVHYPKEDTGDNERLNRGFRPTDCKSGDSGSEGQSRETESLTAKNKKGEAYDQRGAPETITDDTIGSGKTADDRNDRENDRLSTPGGQGAVRTGGNGGGSGVRLGKFQSILLSVGDDIAKKSPKTLEAIDRELETMVSEAPEVFEFLPKRVSTLLREFSADVVLETIREIYKKGITWWSRKIVAIAQEFNSTREQIARSRAASVAKDEARRNDFMAAQKEKDERFARAERDGVAPKIDLMAMFKQAKMGTLVVPA